MPTFHKTFWATLGLLALGAGPAMAAGPAFCNATAFGATGDGVTDNTTALQKAIDTCAAKGGGTVDLAGAGAIFLTGPIHLANHIELAVESGVTLKSVSDQRRFTSAFIGYGYSPTESLVSADNVTDIAITGGGTIDGQGSLWWPAALETKADITAAGSAVTTFAELARWAAAHPSQVKGPASTYAGFGKIPTSNGLPRPWLLEFYNASNVAIHGIHLQNAPMWHLGLRYCNHVTLFDYNVNTDPSSPNTDGLDIVSSNDVLMLGAAIADGDDNIAIKSGFPGFATPAVPASNIIVDTVHLGAGHGFSIGSEAANGVNTLYASNITWTGTQYGFRIKSGRDRGSQFYGIVLDHLSMTDVQHPIYFTDYYTSQPKPFTDPAQPVTPTTPFVHDVLISDLTATNDAAMTAATSSEIVGLPEAPMRNIVLLNVSLQGYSTPKTAATGLELRNLDATFGKVSVTNVPASFIIDETVHVTND